MQYAGRCGAGTFPGAGTRPHGVASQDRPLNDGEVLDLFSGIRWSGSQRPIWTSPRALLAQLVEHRKHGSFNRVSNSNEYMRAYMRARYHRIRAEIVARLGGKCVQCGTTEDLEIDHIDRSTKTINVGQLTSVSRKKLEEEIPKCQLLCQPCHLEKSKQEMGVPHGGGLTGKRNCRCSECKPLKNAYARNRSKKPEQSVRPS